MIKKSLHFLLEDVDRKYGNQYTNNSTIQDYWNNSYMPMKEMKIPPKIEIKTFVEVKADINTLEDLINLTTKYPLIIPLNIVSIFNLFIIS